MTMLDRYDPTGDALIDRAVRYWSQGSLLPKQYRTAEGGPDYPNLVIAATCLRTLDVEPFPNLPDTYVVNGRVGLMHGLQIALAQRADVFPDLVLSDDARAVVELIHGASWQCPRCARGDVHAVEVTMTQATRAGWPGRNPNYRTMPDRMLAARAVTSAIDHHAPGVLRGIASKLANVAALDAEGASLPGGGVGSIPPTATPAGYHRYPMPDAMRAELLARLEALRVAEPVAAHELREEWKNLNGPVVAYDADTPEGRRAYLPDALVLRYMLDEVEEALAAASGGVEAIPTDYPDAAPDGGAEPDADPQYDPDEAPF